MPKLLLIVCTCICTIPVFAQREPDLTKYKAIGEKIDAWQDYCNLLLGNAEEGTLPYKKLTVAGKKGIALAPPDSARAKAMFSLFTGVGYEYIAIYDSAQVYLNQAAVWSKTIHKTDYEMLALSRLDNIYNYTRKSNERKQIIERIKVLVATYSDLKVKIQALTALSGYYKDINNYERAIEYKVKKIAAYREGMRKDTTEFLPRNLGYELSNIAQMFNEMGQYEKAIDYLNQARPYVQPFVFKGVEETFYINLIQAFLGMQQLDSARYYYKCSYNAMAHRDTLYHTLAHANYFFGKYYFDKKQMDSAILYTSLARTLGIQSTSRDAYIAATELLGRLYYAQGNDAQAIRLLSEVLKNNYDFHQKSLAEIHQSLAYAFAKTNRWDSAYAHLLQYTRINDSIQAAAGNENFARAEAQFQNKEKQREINVQRTALHFAHRQRLWLISGLSLAALTALLLIIIYRNKKKTADTLNKKNKELAEANKTKATLFSIIGHDLRSPVKQVYQFLKLQQLNPHALSEQEKADRSNKIETATESLLETMEDLLLWSKTQMSELKPNIKPTALLPVLQPVEQLIQLNIEAKAIRLTNTVAPDIIAIADADFLQTIYRNLLQNAVKASPQNGVIMVTAHIQNNSTVLSIHNSGAAFTQKDFEQQLQSGHTAQTLNGLGLQLVQELSEKMKAAVCFTATPGDGTSAEIIFLATT